MSAAASEVSGGRFGPDLESIVAADLHRLLSIELPIALSSEPFTHVDVPEMAELKDGFSTLLPRLSRSERPLLLTKRIGSLMKKIAEFW